MRAQSAHNKLAHSDRHGLVLLDAPGTSGHELGQRFVDLGESVPPLSGLHSLHEGVDVLCGTKSGSRF